MSTSRTPHLTTHTSQAQPPTTNPTILPAAPLTSQAKPHTLHHVHTPPPAHAPPAPAPRPITTTHITSINSPTPHKSTPLSLPPPPPEPHTPHTQTPKPHPPSALNLRPNRPLQQPQLPTQGHLISNPPHLPSAPNPLLFTRHSPPPPTPNYTYQLTQHIDNSYNLPAPNDIPHNTLQSHPNTPPPSPPPNTT